MSKWSWLWLLSSPTLWRKIIKYNHWIQILSDHIFQVPCILTSSAVLNYELTVQTLLSSTFRLYGSLPNWKRDFLNLSTRRRLMWWCGAGGSWKLNKCRLLPTNTNLTTADKIFLMGWSQLDQIVQLIESFCDCIYNFWIMWFSKHFFMFLLEWWRWFCAAAPEASELDHQSGEASSGRRRFLLTLRLEQNQQTDWWVLKKAM